jgi:hypothetical protein
MNYKAKQIQLIMKRIHADIPVTSKEMKALATYCKNKTLRVKFLDELISKYKGYCTVHKEQIRSIDARLSTANKWQEHQNVHR